MTTMIKFNPLDYELVNADYCLICGERGNFYSSVDRYGIKQRSMFCRCGHVWLSPLMTEAGYAEFYEHYYRPLVSEFHGREINAQTIQDGQTGYATSIINFMSYNIGQSLRVLDIGGSTGVVVKQFAWRQPNKSQDVTVLDPCQTELDEAAKLGLNTIHGTLATAQIDGEFDLITICQTIDHMLDPRADLERCKNLLTADGHIFVDFLDYEKTGEIKIDHPHNFNFKNAARLMSDYFEVVKFERSGNHMRFLASCVI